MARAIVIMLLVVVIGTLIYLWPWLSRPNGLMGQIFGEKETAKIVGIYNALFNAKTENLQFYK